MAVYKRDIIDINLETGNIYRSWLKHSIGYKDQKADHFGVRVFRDGEAVSLTGVSVQGVFMPPQGDPIAITSGNIVSGNTAEVVLPQACYNYNGQFTLAIKLVDASNSVTGTVRIVDGMVDNTHASGTVAPTSAVPSYQEVLSVYEQAIAVIGYSVRFDQSQSLTTAQQTTARGNIDAASTGDVSELKSALNDHSNAIKAMTDDIEYTIPTNTTYINYSTGAAVSNSSWKRTNWVDVNGLDFIAYSRVKYPETANIGIAFYSSDDASSYISGIQCVTNADSLGYVDDIAKVPATAKYARMSVIPNETGFYIKTYKINSAKLVTVDSESFTDSEKAQARANIGSASMDDVSIDIQCMIPAQNDDHFWNVQGDTATYDSYTGYYYAYDAYPVSEGETYKITSVQGGSSKVRIWAITDDSLNILSKAYNYSDTVSHTDVFTVPTGGTKLLMTTYGSSFPSLYRHITSLSEFVEEEKSLNGKRLSILGDSISAFGADIPEGNKVYYTGSNAGVSSGNQMWYSVLCDDLGMSKLVINGWSGSCVTSGVRNDTTYKPASDPSRCESLHIGTTNPDVVLIAMGVNDYSYMSSDSQWGTWDGSTALGSEADMSDYANTDFRSAYATMLARIRRKYPDARIVCITPWFVQRKTTDTGVTYLNDIGKKENDYGQAIKEIADIMNVQVIDGTNIGFNRYNYYPTYCQDSATVPTHPNATGQAYMGHAIAKALANLFFD